MKKAVVMFRNNNWLESLLSMIVSALNYFGYETESKIFPQYKDSDEIRAWVLENKNMLLGKLVITDYTCLSFDDKTEVVGDGKVVWIYSLLELATMHTLFGDGMNYRSMEEEKSETIIKTLLPMIKKELFPKNVDIINESFYDHDKLSIVSFKDMLTDKGFPNVRIMDARNWWRIGYDNFAHMKAEIVQEYDKPDTWIIADLHVSHIFSKSFHQAKIVEYPASAFARWMIKNNMIDIDPKKMAIYLRRLLDEEIKEADD